MRKLADLCITEETRLQEWIERVIRHDRFRCVPATLAQSKQWSLVDGAIRHLSGRFFSIVGLTWEENGARCWQPFIKQEEIGTLGFVARQTEGEVQILCYAKVEPGNVGTVQIAPTCQATQSNLDRVHGGKVPPYAETFDNRQGTTLGNSLQSEQGTRFFHKRNLNTMIIHQNVGITDEVHRWVPLSLFQRFLLTDFLVNTDARSVICTTDWQRLFQRPLFIGNDSFTEGLRASFEAPVDNAIFQELEWRICALRADSPTADVCPVDEMPGWCCQDDDTKTVSNGRQSILHIRVHSETREVTDWDQPIFSTHHDEKQILPCGRKDRLLRFGFRPSWEPGLLKGVELAPGLCGDLPAGYSGAVIKLAVSQSDEGGRFYHDVTHYSVRDVGEIDNDMGLLWLTLAEIHTLLPRGHFNNESRSVLSLLLSQA